MRIILDTEIGTMQLKRGAAALGIPCLHWKNCDTFYPTDVVCMYTIWDGGNRESRLRKRYRPAGARILCIDRSWLREVPDSVQVGWLEEQGIGINGTGTFPPGDLQRWQGFGIDLKPWRTGGEFILVCGNKGSQYNKRSEWLTHCNDWPTIVCTRLLEKTKLPIKYKPHPKTRDGEPLVPRVIIPEIIDHKRPLVECLPGAFAVVVYGSSSATTAIINGVPVIYTGPTLAAKELALQGVQNIERPFLPENREEVFSRLSGSVWRLSELESGAMFKHVGLAC